MPEDEFEVTEVKEAVKPFTIADADNTERACLICDHFDTCAIIAYVNILSMKRDNREISDDFNCSIFEEATAEEDETIV